ncbi:hypothetical protein BST43_14780 [Mycobacteroides saopaulense]|uniref:Alkylmercury lyase n=1 Tax=Mycobacteroides saopaulense TaxID=1578165 RepID=A0A1X0J121_9MYCO|nr:alkylmercury lyase family protein [Mycobacteroides saopaulense]ORB55464.1 hypothetical protein BST43_14780 [Mycobacteroides saopaulense]
MAALREQARAIRQRVMAEVLSRGTAPTIAELLAEFAMSDEELAPLLRDLEGAICVARQDEEHADCQTFQDEMLTEPQPSLGELVYARPFATFKNHYPITVGGQQKWYAECAVEACAISGQFPGAEVIVDSVCRQTKEPVRLVGRDGFLVDYSPVTLRVHLGFPVSEMPHRVVGWCDYNSFFASEDAADQWKSERPQIKGITRAPEEMACLITGSIAEGRHDYDYQPSLPVLAMARHMRKMGLTRTTRLGLRVPEPFWLPTPKMLSSWRRNGLGTFIRVRFR